MELALESDFIFDFFQKMLVGTLEPPTDDVGGRGPSKNVLNTPFFSRWMEFLKIDGDTAKTKKTSFVAENSCKSGSGVLLHSSRF